MAVMMMVVRMPVAMPVAMPMPMMIAMRAMVGMATDMGAVTVTVRSVRGMGMAAGGAHEQEIKPLPAQYKPTAPLYSRPPWPRPAVARPSRPP